MELVRGCLSTEHLHLPAEEMLPEGVMLGVAAEVLAAEEACGDGSNGEMACGGLVRMRLAPSAAAALVCCG